MRTRNNKNNNLSQSKTNNESNIYVNKNDINMYLNKYIFNKKKREIEMIMLYYVKKHLIYQHKNMT